MVDHVVINGITLFNDDYSDRLDFSDKDDITDLSNHSFKGCHIGKLSINCQFICGFKIDIKINYGSIETLIEAIDNNEKMNECGGGNSSSSYGYEDGFILIETEASGSGGDTSIEIKIPVNVIDINSLEMFRAIVKEIRKTQQD